MLLLGDLALPSHTATHTSYERACLCLSCVCLQAFVDACKFFSVGSCARPSGPLELTGESDWEVYEEVSTTLNSRSDSPGSRISVKVFLHPQILV